MKTDQLALSESKPLAPLGQAPSIAHILAAAVQGGVTAENVAVVKELLTMQRELQAQEAQRDFAKDFAALQADCQPVSASKIVPGNQRGEVRYRYAPYEKIMEEVAPLLKTHGFAITFNTEIVDTRVKVTCTLIHTSGHTQSNEFSARIGKGPPGSSEAQGDGAATTYAKRFALCNALNIVVDTDTDARNEGDGECITAEQAADLQTRVESLGDVDMPGFFNFAQATSFSTIPATRYKAVNSMLTQREAQA